jgi:hypothetical protein
MNILLFNPLELFMKKSLLAFCLTAAASASFAHGCPGEMKAVDAKLTTAPRMSEVDMAKVKKLRADDEAAHKSRHHAESMKLLAEAKKCWAFDPHRAACERKSPLFSGDSLQGKPYARGRHFKLALQLDPGL